ncbi:MAG: helix-turn-helix domain-containing protein, partial [Corallococcus sp.]|nr:helix-turn-helix domain-containing protein [Corallococcus sp.]
MDTYKIGKFLQSLRLEKNLTQEELGEQLGVTNKTVSRWETGKYMPPADILLRFSDVYGVSVNEILSGERLATADYQPKAEENIVATLQKTQKLSRRQKAFIACCSVVAAFILLFIIVFLWLYFGLQFGHHAQFVAGTYEYCGEPFLIANGDMIE